MGKEQQNDYYDKKFTKDKYLCHWSKSEYLGLWEEVLKILPNEKILEIGCGTGQFAHMLWEKGYKKYSGFDFSEKGIRTAKFFSSQDFFSMDAYNQEAYNRSYDVLLALEVFEHLNDYKVLGFVEKGKTVIVSIPMFEDEAHVRYFKPMMEVCARYEPFIEIDKLIRHEYWYLFKGVRL